MQIYQIQIKQHFITFYLNSTVYAKRDHQKHLKLQASPIGWTFSLMEEAAKVSGFDYCQTATDIL